MGESAKSSIVRRGISRKKGILLVVVVIISIASACVGFYIFKSAPAAEKTLLFVSIVHRHGERAPLVSYPLDPYKGAEFWPDGLGALIQKGKESMYKLGCFLRQRYDGFLSSTYTPTEISVLSSDVDRCIMSAELLLAGLYPPVGKQIWNAELQWQPVPVHSIPVSSDDIIVVLKHCPLLSQEKAKLDANSQEELDKHQEFISNLSRNAGLDIKTPNDVQNIYGNLKITESQNLELPQWVRTMDLVEFKFLADLGYLADYRTTPVLAKLYAGVLLNEILSNMKQKVSAPGNFKRRVSLYSGHDSTLLHLWRLMNITREVTEEPDYAATIIVELHEINSQYKVKVLYKGGSSSENLDVLKIRGCESNEGQDDTCSFDTFLSALQPACITNFDQACQIP